jgi:hypothetical protein
MGTDQKLALRYGPYLLLFRLPTDSDTLASHPVNHCFVCSAMKILWNGRLETDNRTMKSTFPT